MNLRKLRLPLIRLAFVPIIFIIIFVRPSWSLESAAAFTLELVGYLFLLVGLLIRIWCSFYIGNRKSKELTTEGPYSICRNPLYFGTFFLAVGTGLCFENVLVLLLTPIVIIPVHFFIIKLEEINLENIFGEQYRIYKQNVPRFWPLISNYKSPSTITVNVHSIKRIAVDTIGILLLPIIEDLLELLHESGIIPVLWHLP